MAIATTASKRRRRRPRNELAQQEARTGLAMVTPTLVIILVATVLPVLWTIMLSFQDVRLINLSTASIFGSYSLDNFRYIITAPGFVSSLVTTLVYSVGGTVLSIGVGLIAALVVRKPFRGRGIVRAGMLLPYVAPVVAVTFTWEIMLNAQFGIVNVFGTHVLGWKQAVPFLSEQTGHPWLLGWHPGVPTALLTVIAFETWRYFPFAFLFILARLQAIPAELEEAARVDGATPSQRFFYILLPQLKGVFAVLAVLRFIWTFNKFDDIYLLTGGASGTGVVSVRVYQILTSEADVGQAAAQATLLAVVLVICLAAYFLIFGRFTRAEAGE
jgi:multiple sugar transport system permease protein